MSRAASARRSRIAPVFCPGARRHRSAPYLSGRCPRVAPVDRSVSPIPEAGACRSEACQRCRIHAKALLRSRRAWPLLPRERGTRTQPRLAAPTTRNERSVCDGRRIDVMPCVGGPLAPHLGAENGRGHACQRPGSRDVVLAYWRTLFAARSCRRPLPPPRLRASTPTPAV
jgi:hypothetical protein